MHLRGMGRGTAPAGKTASPDEDSESVSSSLDLKNYNHHMSWSHVDASVQVVH